MFRLVRLVHLLAIAGKRFKSAKLVPYLFRVWLWGQHGGGSVSSASVPLVGALQTGLSLLWFIYVKWNGKRYVEFLFIMFVQIDITVFIVCDILWLDACLIYIIVIIFMWCLWPESMHENPGLIAGWLVRFLVGVTAEVWWAEEVLRRFYSVIGWQSSG